MRRGWAWCAAALLVPTLTAAKPKAHGEFSMTRDDFLNPRSFLKGKKERLPPTTKSLHNFAAAVDKATPAPLPRTAKLAKAAAAPTAKPEGQPPKKTTHKPAANVSKVLVPDGVEMVAPLEPFEEIDEDIDPAEEFKEDLEKQKMFNTRMTRVKAEEDDSTELEEEPQHTSYLSHMLNPTGHKDLYKVNEQARASRAMAAAVDHVRPLSRPGIAPSLAKQKIAVEAEAKASSDAQAERHLSHGDAIASLHSHLNGKPEAQPPQQPRPLREKRVAPKERKQQAQNRLSRVLNATDLANSTEVLPAEVVARLSGAVHVLKAPEAKAPQDEAHAAKWNHSGDPIASLHSRFQKEEAPPPVPVRVVRKAHPLAPKAAPQKPKLLRDVEEAPAAGEAAAIPAEAAARLARVERGPAADTGLKHDLQAAQASSPATTATHHKPKGDVMKDLHERAEKAKHGKEEAPATKPSLPQAHLQKAKEVPASKRFGEDIQAASDDMLAGAIPKQVAAQLIKAEAALEPKVKEVKKDKAAVLPRGNVSDAINAIHKQVHVEPPKPPAAAPKANASAAVPKMEQEDELGFHHARTIHAAKHKRSKGDVDEALKRAAEALKDTHAENDAKMLADEEARMPHKGGDRIEELHKALHGAQNASNASSTNGDAEILPLEPPRAASIPGLHRHASK